MNGVIVHGQRAGWLVLEHADRGERSPKLEYVVPEASKPEVVFDYRTPPRKEQTFHKICLVPIRIIGPVQVNDGMDGAFIAFVEPGTYEQGKVPDAMVAQWYHMYRRAYERWQKGRDREEIL